MKSAKNSQIPDMQKCYCTCFTLSFVHVYASVCKYTEVLFFLKLLRMTQCPFIPAYFGVKCKYLKFKWNPELQKPLFRQGTQLPTAQWYSLNIYSAVFKEKLHSACKKWKIKGWWWKSDRLSKTKALDKTDKAKQHEAVELDHETSLTWAVALETS